MNQLSETKAAFNAAGVSRYVQLATLFRRRIDSGQWSIGEQIPTIEELSIEHGVARATIRQAIGLLEAEGRVSRFRAKGTFVNEKASNEVWCEVETDWKGLLTAREGAHIEILSDTRGETPPHSQLLIGTVAPSYRHLRRRHSRDGSAFLLADVYIDEVLSKKIPKSAFTTKTALRLASSIPGITIIDARQTLTVGAADMETAELLGLALNAPVCFVSRYAVDQLGRLVLVTNGIYRGDVIRVDIKLK